MGDALAGDGDDGPAGSPESESDACIAAVLTEALRAEDDELQKYELMARACQADEERHAAEFGAGVVLQLSGLLPASWSRPPPSVVSVPTDHARLQALLQQHGLDEATVAGDGACQFRALSDQLYRSERYHAAVRSPSCRARRSGTRRSCQTGSASTPFALRWLCPPPGGIT